MNKDNKLYCTGCGAELLRGDRFCVECGARIRGNEWEVEVLGVNYKEVAAVAKSLTNDMAKREKPHLPRNPWVSGSFYLIATVIVVTLFLVVAKTVHFVILPIVIIGALLMVSIIGAFQLRQDKALSEKNFLTLMFLTFKQLPFIRRKYGTKKNSH